MNNNTIEPRLIALLNDALHGPSSPPSLELPPLHDPNILKASGRPLLLEPDASHGNGTQSAGSQLGPKHNAVILPADDDEKTKKAIEVTQKSASHTRERTLGASSPQSLRKILDDDTESSVAISAKKRSVGVSKDDFVKLPQPPPKKQKTTKQVVPPIIIGLFQPPEPPSQAALFPPIASSSFHDSHGRNTLNTVPLKVKVPKDHSASDQFNSVEENKADDKTIRKRNAVRTRKKWTDEETNNLLLGVAKHGVGNWKEILNDQTFFFNARSAADLKDRFRTCCPEELRGKGARKTSPPLGVESGNKPGAKPKSKSSLMSENILIQENIEELTSKDADLNTTQQGSNRAHRKKLEDLAQLGIEGPFQKSDRRQKRPFTEEEDRAILQGFNTYGPAWTRIQRDPKLNLQSRQPTDLRDRYRNRYQGKLKNDNKTAKDAIVSNTQSTLMSTLTQEFDARVYENFGKEIVTASTHDPTSLQSFSSRDGLRTQEMISLGQDMMKAPSLQHQNSFWFKDNFNFPDHPTMESSENLPFTQSFDWGSNIAAPFSNNIGEMDISRLLLDETWPDMPNSSGKEKQSFTGINSILTTSVEPLHNGPSFYNMLNDPDQIEDMNEGSFG
jgi:hypothetical protein